MRKTGRRAAAVLALAAVFSASAVCCPAAEDVMSVPEGAVLSAESPAEDVISVPEEAAEVNGGAESGPETVTSGIRFAKDYKEVYEALKSVYRYPLIYDDLLDYDVMEEMPAAAESANAAVSSAAKSSDADLGGYSETNVRTEGVDEADIIKTDGRYIYILRDSRKLSIVEADGAKMREISVITPSALGVETYGYAEEFFVSGDTLSVICHSNARRRSGSSDPVTVIRTFDISDPEFPVFKGEVQQDGFYKQARLADGVIYLFSEWYPFVDNASYESSDLVARVGGEEVSPDRICIPDILTDANYLIVSSTNIEKPSEVIDYKVLISGGEQLYVSSGGIYALNADYWSERTRTEITKFTYENGAITGRAAGTVRGVVNDTFSIDEYDGNLRVLSTYTGSDGGVFIELLGEIFGFDYDAGWTRYNALYILDENMKSIGRLSHLAEGEEIKSARFFGETAYFVTFRNTDPLFTADLSDPRNPKILGQLKIPGFSAYLHPMGDGLLAGLGYDADTEFGSVTGIKLSLFDLTDPADVKETGKALINGITYLPALENYKSVFADAGRKLIGFFCENRYFVYRLTDDGNFERILLYDFYEDGLQGTSNDAVRGLYIGGTFYLAGDSAVVAFDMENGFAKTAVLQLT